MTPQTQLPWMRYAPVVPYKSTSPARFGSWPTQTTRKARTDMTIATEGTLPRAAPADTRAPVDKQSPAGTGRQAVLTRHNELNVQDVPIPELEPGDILLRVDAALLCGTDVRIYNGSKQKNVTFPTVLGHEFAGTIADANGPLPEGLEFGSQVAVYPLVTCGTCAACRKGHENICKNRQACGYQLTGGLSQYVRVPAVARQNLVPVAGVPAAHAAIIEPVACAYNGQKLAGQQRAETALVVGCGPLGLIHAGLAKSLGVQRVAAVDPIDKRRTMATRFGADLVIEPGPNAAVQ